MSGTGVKCAPRILRTRGFQPLAVSRDKDQGAGSPLSAHSIARRQRKTPDPCDSGANQHFGRLVAFAPDNFPAEPQWPASAGHFLQHVIDNFAVFMLRAEQYDLGVFADFD